MDNIEIIKNEVEKLLQNENSGHGMDHILRVKTLSETIAKNEISNIEIVLAIAYLHDVDDYKLFGNENASNLTNTKMILNKTSYDENTKNYIIDSIKTIGYSKRLDGITPINIEAKIVSDADMIDGMGAIGLMRTYKYSLNHNREFFDRNIFPCLNMTSTEYKEKRKETSINHIFEKLLKLKDLMLTKEGKNLAQKRYEFLIIFLREYFEELNETKWLEYLENFLKNN